MFPKHLRWLFLICAIGNVFVVLFSGFQVFSGTAPSTQMIMPILMIVLFGWMFTQATMTKWAFRSRRHRPDLEYSGFI
jgi:hypothetical protein